MEKAPAQQQMQCQTCRSCRCKIILLSFRFVYVKSWVLKPFSEWCRPAIKLSAWECIEIFLDTYSTYKFIRGFVLIMEGERSVIVQSLHFIFWRVFIATDRRLAYYASLGRLILSSIFVISVRDCIPDSERLVIVETTNLLPLILFQLVEVLSIFCEETFICTLCHLRIWFI
uniref:Ion_trans domain-containing protein n=1 Tax=Angiostrongylus cantonensis TaxID=6313 RepID=A0A0K0D8Q0_ANGCA